MGRSLTQTVGRRPLTMDAWVRSHARLCGICGEYSRIGTGFSTSLQDFSCLIPQTVHPSPKLHNLVIISVVKLHTKNDNRIGLV
jgi:hypothetical protein